MRLNGFGLRPAPAVALAALLLGACATPRPTPAPAPDSGIVVPAEPSAARGRLRPMPVRPLNVRADCRFTDEAGYAASTRLDVVQAEVRDFAATVDVPRRGSCRFDLNGFRQVRHEPHVELRAADGCTVRMWEQGAQVTVAFAECASRCSSGTFDYVWPILVDRSSGRCH
ncbi:hypothetical protein IAI53_13135 [Thauera sp. CAU 1555]|uniref:Lipoprotein n=1 Tax=Thauera sedimentorum TaxID=2767595 RepID=A0ABR9BC78_9RHOO|nr:hypothetical protein [Thauera sedimentorum]MBC9072913.1 hypothetical protein [Thauera sedimentorum]MBD8503832.1 hypothetical protein [Thauera sedimentorum]